MKSKEIITFDKKRLSLKYDKDLTCSWKKILLFMSDYP